MKNQLTKMILIGFSLVVTGFVSAENVYAQNCRPNANQIAIFADWKYQGQCKVLDIAGYATPQAMGFDNDSISSILVGSSVQAEICANDLYKGACQILVSDNDFLENTSVGNDSVSSIRITRKGAGGTSGPKDLRSRLIGSWVAGPDKFVFIGDRFEFYKRGKLDFTAPYNVVDDNKITYAGAGGAPRSRIFTFRNNDTILTSTNPETNASFDYKRVSGTKKAAKKK